MNVIEQAKKLEKTGWVSPLTETECFEIATMLRQQQAEIEELTKLMNFWHDSFNELRTHPAKTLTYEEIDSIGINNEGVLRLFYMIKGDVTGLQFKEALRDFARAILRKANEK